MKIKVRDPIIRKVIKKFVGRSDVGYKKYGVTLEEDPADLDTWLNHLQEELMDAVNYIEKARHKLVEPEINYKMTATPCSGCEELAERVRVLEEYK